MHVREMISTHPHVQAVVDDALIRCIEDCYACAQICTICADACLGEPNVTELTQCIRRNLDCADICSAAGAMVSRRTGSNAEVLRATITACLEACRICGEECRKHAQMHEHCRICADVCDSCREACHLVLQQVH